ncbi:hypothetical protein QPL79_06085 [Ignisphaera sp. 4213-co]|uniref:Uncharacterized protein n=1 Tax=Ignisphaera cupida TaxID=3050454 RepID=A0ABD4Z6H7_9CREN|nr:hypothetical protein [Ignisphaera sp. 4213-co]MDK6028927.1 hypothetical protein [Ignisphaera sp. 4213-co]
MKQFSLDLYKEAKCNRAKESFNEFRKLLSEEKLENIVKSSEKFRKGFKIR